MTGSPLDIRFAEPAEAARAPAGMAPAWPSSRRWVWLLLAAALADIGLAFAGLNPARGYRVLIPFAVLGLYALGFAVAVRAAGADGIVLRLAALAERRWPYGCCARFRTRGTSTPIFSRPEPFWPAGCGTRRRRCRPCSRTTTYWP